MNQTGRVETGKTLRHSDVSHLSKMTGFSPKEVRDWHVGFQKDCPSGKLDKIQFNEAYKTFNPVGRAEKFIKYLFRTFDTDGSGDIDFGEFLSAISITYEKNWKKKLAWMFSLYDINHDGFISKKEMREMMNAIYDLSGEEKSGCNSPDIKVEQIFSKWDIDGDQKLSKKEFISGCLRDDNMRRWFKSSVG